MADDFVTVERVETVEHGVLYQADCVRCGWHTRQADVRAWAFNMADIHRKNCTEGKPKLASNRSPNWAFMQRFEVPNYDSDGNYLTRWRVIQTPWFGVYVHRFDGPDPRPTLHDHPWDFTSVVLRGGYIEATAYSDCDALPVNADKTGIPESSLRVHSAWQTFAKGAINRKKASDAHTIVTLLRVPTWTLMFVGKRTRMWGYIEADGTWIAFDQHPYNDEFLAALARRKAS